MDISEIKTKSQQVVKLQTEIHDAVDALGHAIAAKYPEHFREYRWSMGTGFFMRTTDERFDYLHHDDPKDWGTRDEDGNLEFYPQTVLEDLQRWADAIALANDADCNYA